MASYQDAVNDAVDALGLRERLAAAYPDSPWTFVYVQNLSELGIDDGDAVAVWLDVELSFSLPPDPETGAQYRHLSARFKAGPSDRMDAATTAEVLRRGFDQALERMTPVGLISGPVPELAEVSLGTRVQD